MKRTLLFILMAVITVITNPGNSLAQINWAKSENNPLLTPGGTWTSHGFPFVYLTEINDTLRMWFTGADGDPNSSDRIGYATSTDGINFDLHDWPVLEPSGGSNFDSEGVFGASVLFDGETYRMWYNGYNTQPYYAGQMQVGLATSTDGLNWTRYSDEPVLELGSPGDWDGVWAYANTVIFEDGLYKMWYTGYSGGLIRIGYATSTDGFTWIKDTSNPVIELGGSGFGSLTVAQNARVLHIESGYEMWFNGQNGIPEYDIYYATSEDGIDWSWSYNTVLMTGIDGSFDSDWVWHPCVIYDEGVYRMWYSGYNGSAWALGYATDSTQVGIKSPVDNQIAGNSHLQLFPNPASDKVMITFKLDAADNVGLRLINTEGRVMKVIRKEFYNTGNHTLILDVRDLPGGVYLCLLETDLKSHVSKKLVVR